MEKQEYLNEISKHLRKLPSNEYNEVMNSFVKIFKENEKDDKEIMYELGQPKEVAYKVLLDILDKKIKIIDNENIKDDLEYKTRYKDKIINKRDRSKEKKSLFTVSIMALIESPIDIKIKAVIFSIIGFVFFLIAVFLLTIGRKILTAFSIGIIFILMLGVDAFSSSSASGLYTMGIGLIITGITIILIAGIIFTINIIIEYLAKLIQYILREKAYI